MKSELKLTRFIPTRILLQMQPEIIVAKMSQSTTLPQSIHTEDQQMLSCPQAFKASQSQYWSIQSVLGTLHYSYQHRRGVSKGVEKDQGSRKERDMLLARYRAPSWLINKAWDIQATRVFSGWNIKLRSYNVIPGTSAVFSYIKNRNLAGNKNLFSSREASPFDIDSNGKSLVWVCAAGALRFI